VQGCGATKQGDEQYQLTQQVIAQTHLAFAASTEKKEDKNRKHSGALDDVHLATMCSKDSPEVSQHSPSDLRTCPRNTV